MDLHPRTVGLELLLVGALVATMLVEMWLDNDDDTLIGPLSVAVIVLAALPVLMRWWRPGLALAAAMAALYLVMATSGIYQTVPLPSMVIGYTLALTHDRRTTIIAGVALVPFVVAAVLIFGHDDALISPVELPKNLAFVAAPLLLGSAARERRNAHAALVERAETAERTREEEARRRVGEERLRIAREVHDVVAHAMVAINVQAGVSAHLMDRDTEQARRTLEEIKKASGAALADLRATLGDLRSPGDPADPADRDDRDDAAPVRPAPSLGELSDLGERLRYAGLEVDLDIDPGAATLPAAVTATGYRIVQEALTNVARHARGSRASVRVVRQDDRLLIDVTDDGAGAPTVAGPRGAGHGVRGMRERAQAAGGTLEAGPRDGGGWRVRAMLPVGAA